MKKSILLSMAVLLVIACTHKPATQPPASTKKDTAVKTTLTPTSFPKSKDIFMVTNKMDNHATLDKADYTIIDNYLLFNHDEDGSEGIGYTMFNYFKGNKPANEGYLNFLNNKGAAFKEKVRPKLILLMSIDLIDDKYTYETLVSDFSLFKESSAAEKAIKTLIANNKEEYEASQK